MKIILNFLAETWRVAEAMAPYLVFGFFAAGILRIFISPEWLRRHMGGKGLTPVIKAVLFGAPLPLCSCGVLAVTASLRQQGAGRAAATGFLLSTPQTGVDSIIATWGLLGPLMALVRPILAVISGITGGILVSRFGEQDEPAPAGDACPGDTGSDTGCGSCCAGESNIQGKSARDVSSAQDDSALPFPVRLRQGLYYGLVTLPSDLAKPLVTGIFIAGLISALVPPNALSPWIGGGPLAMLVMIAVGIPLYVCATASIPIAISFMHMGASPGAALAFLVAGPATNAATLAVLWKMMGKRTTLLFLLTVCLTALLGGLAYDALSAAVPAVMVPAGGHVHQHENHSGGWEWIFVVLLLIGMSAEHVQKGLRAFIRRANVRRPDAQPADSRSPHQDALALHISNMTCAHCVESVTRAIREILPDAEPNFNLQTREVIVPRGRSRAEQILERLQTSGFSAHLLSR